MTECCAKTPPTSRKWTLARRTAGEEFAVLLLILAVVIGLVTAPLPAATHGVSVGPGMAFTIMGANFVPDCATSFGSELRRWSS